MNTRPPIKGIPQVRASDGLPSSFASDTAHLALTGRSKTDAGTRRFESLIVALLSLIYGIALILVALVFGHHEFRQLFALPLPRWGVLVLACLGFTALLRGLRRLGR